MDERHGLAYIVKVIQSGGGIVIFEIQSSVIEAFKVSYVSMDWLYNYVGAIGQYHIVYESPRSSVICIQKSSSIEIRFTVLSRLIIFGFFFDGVNYE